MDSIIAQQAFTGNFFNRIGHKQTLDGSIPRGAPKCRRDVTARSLATSTKQLTSRLGLVTFTPVAITKILFDLAAIPGQTVNMLACCMINRMNAGSAARPPRFRRCIARLMVLVVFVASFALAASEPVLAISAKGRTVVEMTTSGKHLPKPCRKMVLPGAVNTCPSSSFSFSFIPTIGADYAVPTLVTATLWRLNNSSLPAQCCSFSPYRPPRSEA